MPATDLGVLKDMPGIRDKASTKLVRREEQYRDMLLSTYKDMGMAEEAQYQNGSPYQNLRVLPRSLFRCLFQS